MIKCEPTFPKNVRSYASLGFVTFVFGPSVCVFQKYGGVLGLLFYLVTAFSIFWLLNTKPIFARYLKNRNHRQVLLLAGVTFLCLIAIFCIVYPIANSVVAGRGSDRDDALNVATRRLLSGRYPYEAVTYLGNPISPLPGSLFLAIPFVVLGNSAYQNVFWLFAFLLSARMLLKDERYALSLLWTILAVSPVTLQEFVAGGDLLANSIFVFAFAYWLISSIPNPNISSHIKLLIAVLFGIGLSSRAHFVLIFPLVFSTLARNVNLKVATKYCSVSFLVLVLTIVPFYVYKPASFSPLHTINKVRQFSAIAPCVTFFVPALAAALSIALSLRRSNSDIFVFFRNCAVVLAFPIVTTVILNSIQLSRPEFALSGFALSSVFFGAAAFALSTQSTGVTMPPNETQ